MTYSTAMITRGIAAVAAAIIATLTLGTGSAQADVHRPSHPAAHLRWEAWQMHCKVLHATELPMGPANQGITCQTHGRDSQQFNLLYYPKVLPAMHWWRTYVHGNSWVTRDGFIIIVPAGSSQSGEDTGAYDRTWADYAASRTNGFLRAI